ncbi:hypothetical protein JI742_00560 [Piscinibacter sp. Jin2]|uniref:DUF5666 domain-containing protein n=1 Tax=Aquariibacter lacus TaxID=2801332 RepID=A0A9X1BQ33_9BURK|nr:DUF5666 domain-containing protein [Piscinibacter lacus]MBL0718369.1 hypothetical protein [Piscinibacter lacus]
MPFHDTTAWHAFRPSTWRRGLLAAAASALLIAACGGGGGSAGLPGSGGTGFASGPISGFGSVIVNGVRYDDRAAELRDEDGQRLSRSGSMGDPLQLGVLVDLEGRVAADGLSGTADRVVLRPEVIGLVDAVDAAAASLRVLGQAVKVKRTTVFTGLGGLADLAAGEVVAVHGLLDDTGAVVATRVERLAPSVAAYTGDFRIRGPLDSLSGSAPTQSFRVSGLRLRTDAGTVVSGNLANGALLSVRLAKSPSEGVYRALRVTVRSPGFAAASLPRAEIEGFITRFDSLMAFEVNGFPVRTDGSTLFEDGTDGVRLGARIEVEGPVVQGVLQARRLEIEKLDDNDEGNDDQEDDASFEFVGTASEVQGDAVSGRFTVQGQRLSYDSRTRFDDGLVPSQLNGQRVEVDAEADGVENGVTRYRATRVERED